MAQIALQQKMPWGSCDRGALEVGLRLNHFRPTSVYDPESDLGLAPRTNVSAWTWLGLRPDWSAPREV